MSTAEGNLKGFNSLKLSVKYWNEQMDLKYILWSTVPVIFQILWFHIIKCSYLEISVKSISVWF